MSEQHIVTVNGKQYDTRTGLPVTAPVHEATVKPQSKPTDSVAPAQAVHTSTEKSQTLRRAAVKRPSKPAKTPPAVAPAISSRRRSFDVKPTRRPDVVKFSPTAAALPKQTETPDIAPRVHPHVVKATKPSPLPNKTKPSAKELAAKAKGQKNLEIQKALAAPTPKKTTRTSRHRSFMKTHPRLFSTAAVVTAMLVLVGSLVWINLPTISVKIASSQAGLSAEFPHFLPDGYSLELPVKAENSSVRMVFKSRSDDTRFSFTQSASGWDSEAVRLSVEKDSNGQFLTSRDRGLTVYTYNSNQSAAWVNKGILYRIDGNATLSSDAILRIANSL